MGSLTFSSAAGLTMVGADGVLTLGGDITQSGSGDVTNSTVAYDLGAAVRSFKGSGAGKVNFNGGSIAGSGGVKVDGGYYVFGAVSGTFPGLTGLTAQQCEAVHNANGNAYVRLVERAGKGDAEAKAALARLSGATAGR